MLDEPNCSLRNCKHFIGIKGDYYEDRLVCSAFLDEIPDEIAYGNNLHESPFPGQKNNIVYESKESK